VSQTAVFRSYTPVND